MEVQKYSSNLNNHRKFYDENESKKVTFNSQMKMYDYMKEKNVGYLRDISLNYYNTLVTYKDLFEKISDYAKAFHCYGINEGDVVTIVMPNIPEIVYIKYALNRIGAISNLIDPRMNPDRILERTNETGSKLLMVSMEICDKKIEPIINNLKVDNVVAISATDAINFSNDLECNLTKLLLSYNKLLFTLKKKSSKYIGQKEFLKYGRDYRGRLDTAYVPNTPVSIFYTSGTTGKFKGVVQINESYNAMVEEMKVAGSGFKRQETFLGAIPFFMTYGSLCGMHNALANGWSIYTVPKFNPEEFDLLIKKYKPNDVLGVPRWWEEIVKYHRVDDLDFSFLKRPVTGGARITSKSICEINDFFEKHGAKDVKLKVGYGATELGGCISATCEDHGFYDYNSSGILLPNAIGMVIDPVTLEELPQGTSGELAFHSKTMMMEYYNEEEETKNITIYKNGLKFYRTGDKGYIDENGSIHFIDRYKRAMTRPDGHTVHASPIEEVILKCPLVDDCCVVGLTQDKMEGDIPTAFIKLKNKDVNFKEAVDIIDELSLKELSEREKALVYVEVSELVYNGMEKIDYLVYEKKSLNDLDYIIKDYTFFENPLVLKKKRG